MLAHAVVLIPPQHIAEEVRSIQDRLLTEHGAASAFALPPVLPIGYVQKPADVRRITTPRTAPGFRTVGWKTTARTAFLGVETFGRIEWLDPRALTFRPSSPPPVDAATGIVICAASQATALTDIVWPAARFRADWLAVLTVNWETGTQWWQRSSWRLSEETRLKDPRLPGHAQGRS